MHKIIAMTTFNNGEAFVLEKPINFIYTKYGKGTIVGTDGVFLSCYKYGASSANFKAFGGREFDLELSDGTVEHCQGQWWDGISKRAIQEVDGEIINVTVGDVAALKKWFVFAGKYAIKERLEELRATYTEKVCEYGEYQKILRLEEKILNKSW